MYLSKPKSKTAPLCALQHRPEIHHVYNPTEFSCIFYRSKRGTHGEPSSLKPARKEVNYTSLSLPSSLGSGGLLASRWAESINARCFFPFAFLPGGESSRIPGRRKEKIHGSLIAADFSSVSTIPFDILIFPPFCYSSSWQAFCLQNLLTKSVYQSCNRTPGGGNSAHDLGIPIIAPEWFLFK